MQDTSDAGQEECTTRVMQDMELKLTCVKIRHCILLCNENAEEQSFRVVHVKKQMSTFGF